MENILIIEDNKDMQFLLSSLLKEEGYNVVVAGNGKTGIKEVKKGLSDLILLDIKLPDIDGMKVLEGIKQIDKNLAVIMLTAFGDIKGAVEAMKLGAFDYITKPFNNEEIILVVKRALQSQHLTKEVEFLRKKLGKEKSSVNDMTGQSYSISQVLKQVEIVAPTGMTVVIQGESGTGKELIARMIHSQSRRADKPFIAIDCGTLPETLVESELFGCEKGAFTGADERREGKFEQACGGTLFLDEITNLSDTMQVKFLRVIQERKLMRLGGQKDVKVDVRIIVAANINLSEAVNRGKFRSDLFHRLNEFYIDLPLLSERKEDIPVLVKCFLDEANYELGKNIKGFSAAAMKILLDYRWPGNARELRNAVKRAVLLTEVGFVEPLSLPAELNGKSRQKITFLQDGNDLRENYCKDTAAFKKVTKSVERDLILKALEEAGGNKAKAAKNLRMNRKTLYRKLKSFGI